jgi:sulfate transport system substrate-binding protein
MRRLALAGCLAALVFTGVAAAGTNLSVVAYSIPTAVFPKLIAAYQATPQGKGVGFQTSFAASEVQSKAVAAGLPADVVNFSISTDMDRLVQAGLVAKSWDANPEHGVVSRSVVVFVLRNGNPKHIRTWDDLVKPGVQVLTPNPFSSGSAKWNILAAYDAERHLGKTDKQATNYVKKLFQHVVSQDTSGSNATNTFLSGKGDVLITYESEALNARMQGKNLQYVIPRQTMLIQLPAAVLKNSPNKEKANEFIRYLKSVPAQQLFAQYGFRPVNKQVANEPSVKKQFPARPGIFTVDDKTIGGWRKADKVWFDPKNGRMAKIEQEDGGPTSG